MIEPTQPLLLIVLDDLRRLTQLDSLLGRAGYLITTCSTRADAEKAVGGHKVDLVLVGRMGEEGEEVGLIWKIKQLSPSTKSILLVDEPDWAGSVAPLDSGADDLLSAPYTDQDLMSSVGQLLSDRVRRPPPGESRASGAGSSG